MDIKDFLDFSKLQKMQDEFSEATGLAAIAVGMDGNYITEGSNFTDFCMKYTRGSEEGCRRCVKCDNECTGTYFCHAGLMDFSADIVVNGEKVGAIIGGQVLPNPPDEEKFRETAIELGINPDEYITALRKVPISTESRIRCAAELLRISVNQFVTLEYFKYLNVHQLKELKDHAEQSADLLKKANNQMAQLNEIAAMQQVIAINARIEAARSGKSGVGFAVVANEMQNQSSSSKTIYEDIGTVYKDIENCVSSITDIAKNLSVTFGGNI